MNFVFRLRHHPQDLSCVGKYSKIRKNPKQFQSQTLLIRDVQPYFYYLYMNKQSLLEASGLIKTGSRTTNAASDFK